VSKNCCRIASSPLSPPPPSVRQPCPPLAVNMGLPYAYAGHSFSGGSGLSHGASAALHNMGN
jgi:hypothetical protein